MFKFTTNKLIFSKYLSNCSAIANSKMTGIGLLDCVFIQSKVDNITLMTSNGELFVKSTIQASIDNDGDFLVNAKKFNDILKTFDNDDNISILYNDKNIEITGEKTNAIFKLQTVENDGYPEFDINNIATTFTISSSVLKSMIDKTAYSISKDNGRYHLSGIWFEKLEGETKLSLVSTDGQRLSYIKSEIDLSETEEIKKMIPISTISELLKVINDDENITISFTNKSVIFETSTTQILSNLIESNFLDYKAVIPKHEIQSVINTDLLRNSLKRVSSILDDKNRSPRIRFDFDRNSLKLSASNESIGEAEETISIDYDGNPFSIGLNHDFVLQSLSRIDTTTVIMMHNASGISPIVLKEDDNDRMMFVIGPMRLN